MTTRDLDNAWTVMRVNASPMASSMLSNQIVAPLPVSVAVSR